MRKTLKSTGASTHACLSPGIMKLSEDVDKLVRASKSEEDVPQEDSLHSVEGFGQIDKGHQQILLMCSTNLR